MKQGLILEKTNAYITLGFPVIKHFRVHCTPFHQSDNNNDTGICTKHDKKNRCVNRCDVSIKPLCLCLCLCFCSRYFGLHVRGNDAMFFRAWHRCMFFRAWHRCIFSRAWHRCIFSRAWHRCIFSRAWHQLHIFPRLPNRREIYNSFH